MNPLVLFLSLLQRFFVKNRSAMSSEVAISEPYQQRMEVAFCIGVLFDLRRWLRRQLLLEVSDRASKRFEQELRRTGAELEEWGRWLLHVRVKPGTERR